MRWRALLRLRNRELAALQELQNILQLRLGQGMQGGLTVMLTNIIADRLAIVALIQQLAQLRQDLPTVMILLGED